MKNKILLIATTFLLAFSTKAQLSTNLIVSSQPPATISKWAITPGVITLVVNNQQGPRKAKIRTTLKTIDGTEVSTTDMNLAQTIIFPDGQTLLNAASVFPLEIQKFTGKYQSNLNKTGKLPADNYQLCVELVEPSTFQPIAPQKCGSFYLAALQLPICMMPAKDQALDINQAKTAITFRWTPLVPKPKTATSYRLQVFEILDNQQPVQALRSNQPILDKIIVERTQYIWQPQGGLGSFNEIDSIGTKKFIWSVQALDALQTPIGTDGNVEGRSEPIVFNVVNKNDKITFPPNNHKVAGCVCTGTSWGAIDCMVDPFPIPTSSPTSTWGTLPVGCPITGTYTVRRTTNLYMRSTYNCLPGCQPQLKYELFKTGGALIATNGGTNGSKVKFFVPQALGSYYIVITATCSGTICGTCTFNFTVVP